MYDDPTLEFPPDSASFGYRRTWPRQPAPTRPRNTPQRVARRRFWPLAVGGPVLLGALLGWGASAELPDAPDLTGRRAAAALRLVRETRMALGTNLSDIVTLRALGDATHTQRAGELIVQPIARLFAQVPPQVLLEVVAAYAAVAAAGSGSGASALAALRDTLGQLTDAAQDAQLHLSEFRAPDAALRDKVEAVDALQRVRNLAKALETGNIST